MQNDLIYDLGLHIGEDTDFYLKKGFRVVAVEANSELCEQARARFADAVADGRLTIVNRAIAEQPGEITFFDNVHHGWGTIFPEWADRNRRLGAESVERTVTATTMEALLAEYGAPYYVKIDIEGADMIALSGLAATSERPRYVSLESNKTSFSALRQEFATLVALGYDRFKIVSQPAVHKQRLLNPPAEGAFVDHRFSYGASGAFGEEAPGKWLTAEAAIEAYRPIFLRYALVGDDPFIRSRYIRKALRMFGFRASWYDTHARLAGS